MIYNKTNYVASKDKLAEWRKEMKNTFKKVMGALMAVALLVGVLGTQTDMVQAKKNKAFTNFFCSSRDLRWGYLEMNGVYTINPCFCFYLYGEPQQLEETGAAVQQGKTIYAVLNLPSSGFTIKSVSIKSSNNKVLKVNKKKGTFKAVKKGTATIFYKVVWRTSKKVDKINEKNRKITKKGKNYTATIKVKVKVCKSHKYGEWKVTKEPTCVDVGEKQRTCSKCGGKETEIISETGHVYDSSTSKCTVCGQDNPFDTEE